MSEQDLNHALKQELNGSAIEPLLPIEKKLISISLLTGLVLLAVLLIANRYFPLSH